MTDGAWLVVEEIELPEAWRARARPALVIPLLAEESRELLESGSTAPALEPLDERLLQLLGEGLGTSQIAERTGRPERSVQRHLARLRRRLGASNNSELAVTAARLGLREADARVGGTPRSDAGDRAETKKSNRKPRRRSS